LIISFILMIFGNFRWFVSFFSVYFFWLPENFPDFLDYLSDYFDSFYYFLDYVSSFSDFLWIFIFKKLNLDGFF
jgi:hypothetical protein